MRKRRLGGSPVSEHAGRRYAEQLRAFRHVEAAEEPALDHQRLARLQTGELLEGGVQAQQFVGAGRRLIDGLTQRDDRQSSPTALVSLPPTGGLDQDLAHGARGDALEAQTAAVSET